MKSTSIFKRQEVKYLMTKKEKEELSELMKNHMKPDSFGNSTIRNIYYDTPDKLLIRRSLDKPKYKEKLRVRSYEQVKGNSKVFIEIKKKYKGIVYKRRMALEEKTAKNYLAGNLSLLNESQISKEIDYLIKYYGDIEPAIFLSYDREAYFSKIDPNFRMTFDENIIIRDYDISLSSPVYGESDMLDGKVILEVKTVFGMPKWLLEFLSEKEIYKTSFSKYGTAYMDYLLPKYLEKNKYTKKIKSIKTANNIENIKSKTRVEKIKRGLKSKNAKIATSYISAALLFLTFFANLQFQTSIPYKQVDLGANSSIDLTANTLDKAKIEDGNKTVVVKINLPTNKPEDDDLAYNQEDDEYKE